MIVTMLDFLGNTTLLFTLRMNLVIIFEPFTETRGIFFGSKGKGNFWNFQITPENSHE
jgi:hypothetical protein